jgi:hypothetical protein
MPNDPNDLASQFLAQQPGAQMPVPPNPIQSAASYVNNLGALYQQYAPDSLKTAVVNDPLYRASKGYLSNASQVFGGKPIDDNTTTDPATGRVSLGNVPPPAPPGAPQPQPTPSSLITGGGSGDDDQNGVPPLQTVNVPASNISTIAPVAQTALSANTDAQMAANASQQGGNNELGEIDEKVNAARAQGLGDLSAEKAGLAGQEKASIDNDDAVMQKIFAQQDQLKNQLSQQKIDPDRWWNSRSTAEQVGRTIGSILFRPGSGFSSILGSENIKDHIDRDIAAQKQQLETSQQGWENGNNLLARIYQQQGSKREAEMHLHGLLTQSVQDGVDQAALIANTGAARARAHILNGQLEEKRQGTARDGITDWIKTHKYTPAYTATVGGGAGTPANDKDIERLIRLPNGRLVLADDKTQKEEKDETIAAHEEVKSLAMQIRAIRSKGGVNLPTFKGFGSDDSLMLKSLEDQLNLAMHKKGLRDNEEIMKKRDEIAGNLFNPSTGVDKTLDTLVAMGDAGIARSVNGLPEMKYGYGMDPKTGQKRPTLDYKGRNYRPTIVQPGQGPAGAEIIK